MSELQLRFTGLCALVPNDATPPNQMRVVMVVAADHHPVLVAFADQVRTGDGCRDPDDYFDDWAGIRMALFKLDGQELSVRGAAPRSLSVDIGPLAGYCPEDSGAPSKYSLRWVGSMARINAGYGRLIPRGLDPTAAPPEVAARFKLTQGELTTNYFAVDTENVIVKWQFRNEDGTSDAGFEQALAEQVLLTFPFAGSRLWIDAMGDIHDDAPSPAAPICLEPTDGVTYAWVANMPRNDVVQRSYGYEAQPAQGPARAAKRAARVRVGNRDPDWHFRHFYDLVVDGGPEDRIPYPDHRCEPGPPASGNPKCPPVLLEPKAGA